MLTKWMVTVFILIIATITSSSYSQCCNPVGAYIGGTSGETKTYGYYYFREDSSFIFFTTKNIRFNQTDLKENDTITTLGKGKWYIERKYLITKFEEFPEPILQKETIRYHSKTVQPYDSFFLKVNIKGGSNRSVLFLFGNKPNKLIEYPGANGQFDLRYPIEYLNDSLQLNLAVEKPNFICIQQNNNYHEIEFDWENVENSPINVIKDIKIPYKIETTFNNGSKQVLFNDKRFIKVIQGDIVLSRLLDYNIQIDSLNAHIYKSIKRRIAGH